MQSATLEPYAQALRERAAQNGLRSLRSAYPLSCRRIKIEGRELIDFASNDYLGLSRHPELIERATKFTLKYGAGNGASRLLSGNLEVFEKIESKISALKGSESALILPTGFQANSTILPSLLGKFGFAALDKLAHRSMIEGLSNNVEMSRWFRFKHNDFDDFRHRLQRSCLQELGGPLWLLTESVFSMDGDSPDFEALDKAALESGFSIYIDEAHATGVLGENGMGFASRLSAPHISMGTFGKGLGSFGAYVCLPKLLRDYLINFCPGLIYSTALPPPVLGAIEAALELVPHLDAERKALRLKADSMRKELRSMGFDCGKSESQIIPVILGSSIAALELSRYLENSGFYAPAIRPPSVPESKSRLRLSLCADHRDEEIESLLLTLRRWNEKKA